MPLCSIVPNARFFGQFGGEHIYQKACDTEFGSSNRDRFGMLLNAISSPVKNNVCSIQYVYIPEDKSNQSDTYFSYSVIDDYVNRDTIVNLNYKGSPYFKKELLLNGNGTGGNTCDYFQKLIVLNDSTNCTDYKNLK